MMGWIILGTYVIGFIALYRVAYRLIDEHEGSDRDDAVDRFGIAVMSIFAAFLWPLILPCWAIWRVATPKTARQKRQEIEGMEKYKSDLLHEIKNLEYELGLRRDKP